MALFRLSRACLRTLQQQQAPCNRFTYPSSFIAVTHSIYHPIFPSANSISPDPNPNHDSRSFSDSPIKPSYNRISSSELFKESFTFEFYYKFKFRDFSSTTKDQKACISTSSGAAEKESPKRNADAVGGNGGSKTWIDLYLKENAQPYARLARLDKPIGTWLLAWPCFW
ncbi:Palmitoyl-protein thioesterase 1 [Sarracenia purpurea var. burkii]